MSKYRVPVVRSSSELTVPWESLMTIIGGRSVIDSGRLHVNSREEARKYLLAYGFDLNDSGDFNLINEIKDLALVYLTDTLLPYGSLREIPSQYLSYSIEDLIIEASHPQRHTWPYWPCVQLKLLHCAAHALLTHDRLVHDKALELIRERFTRHLQKTGNDLWFGDQNCLIPLVDFTIKEDKSFARSMTKLLHKPGNLALHLHDRLGVRFVTYDIFSAILLIKYLRSRNIISPANTMPEHTRNSLAELKEIRELYKDGTSQFIVDDTPEEALPKSDLNIKPNPHSDKNYRMIKLTERLLVRIGKNRRVFTPYEIQILDQKAWLDAQRGRAAHRAYEKRQLTEVRKRLFGNPD
ncbi:MAG: TIGR04552 family protein [Candidatus Dadabacteria bacterium]|nr:MAG: TIGR04552 family protein [Candidatus Dadabacteria bacterium]